MLADFGLLNWFRRKAREDRAREDGDRVIFPVALPARIFFGGGALMFVVASIVAWFAPEVPLWQKLAAIPITILALWLWPSRIVVDSSGVSKRNVLGIRRALLWEEVRTLDLAARRHQAHVGGEGKLRIAFTPLHVDLYRFVEEIRHRAPAADFMSDL